ncbi:Rho-binding antiterminator [Agarivorans aestuarii]|uniref:Rho-binding antiterminator n=1 Tax=Agarivorans aestuarii TaxID=1563703 RepID=A0ABU7GA25_9ALTE|nr:Rho-binding antiterminator [Agarivorans aestuarii]MEE1675919.1 Rho-binding antiterminator [Agarivorans aestuarii]
MISCDNYDYIEIACMYRYLVKVQLVNGEQVHGLALDTKRNQLKQECILLKHANQQFLVVLDDIQQLEVMVDNPHFSKVSFR